MVRTMFVRPRALLRFVWGRTKHIISWLKNLIIQLSPLQGISFLGQGAALLTLGMLMFTGSRNDAQANEALSSRMTDVAHSGLVSTDLISMLGVCALILLVGANYILWRQRSISEHAQNMKNKQNIMSPQIFAKTGNSEFSNSSLMLDQKNAPWFDLEQQCQQLAHIADQSKHAPIEAEIDRRVKEEQLARICHDLRTPLNAVIGFSDLMRAEMFGPLGHDKYIEYAEHIGQSGHNLLSAVDDIFDRSNASQSSSSASENILETLTSAARPAEDLQVKGTEPAE